MSLDCAQGKGGEIKEKVFQLLRSADLDLSLFKDIPRSKILQPLFSALCSADENIKWPAVMATGIIVADLGRRNLEAARNILRRMLWSLNNESGNIGWGQAEAMGEILARNEGLALEFAPLLVACIREDGNYLEYEPLQSGVLWGLGRLAGVNPQCLRSLNAPQYLLPFLDSADARVRGLAAWGFGQLGTATGRSKLESLLADETQVTIFTNPDFRTCRVADLVREALQRTQPDG
ncbi:MAG: HEAT repeat domain-containing protein [Deltaproteobacteria bacterium]|nr:HEAT repeat domain-containing protein [Deltaproteobacteria bacterium]